MENGPVEVLETKPQISPIIEAVNQENRQVETEDKEINYTKIPDEEIVKALKNEIESGNSVGKVEEVLRQEAPVISENTNIKKSGILSRIWRFLRSFFR
jgi:hypothetical protein